MTEVEVTQEDEKTEAYIRIAIWNAAMSGGMGQELSQAFIRRVMDEPLMKRVIARHRTRSAGGEGEIGWLIEMANNDAPCPRWWHPQKGWVWDANEALRFARKQDAEEFSKSRLHGAGGKATEHKWLSITPAPETNATTISVSMDREDFRRAVEDAWTDRASETAERLMAALRAGGASNG